MPALKMPAFARSIAKAGSVVAPVPHRNIIAISGSQASEFLHGILASGVGQRGHLPFFSAFLNAQGRVLYDVFIYTRPGQYLIEYDSRPVEGLSLLALLKQYKLRAKVKIQDVSAEYDVWQAWNSEPSSSLTKEWRFASSGAVEPVWSPEAEWPWGTKHEQILDRRAEGMGKRILTVKDDLPRDALEAGYVQGQSDDYLVHRIMHGVPEGFDDIPSASAFPMDSNLDVMGGLDFRKGCYVGQELTVRTYHTGVIRKRILPFALTNLQVDQSTTVPATPLSRDIKPTANDNTRAPRGTGKVLSFYGGVGLALLRLEHVEALEKNAIGLTWQVSNESESQTIQPWWPSWWPIDQSKA